MEHNGDGSLCLGFGTGFPMEPGFIPFNTENRPCVFLLIFVRNGAPTEDKAVTLVFQLPQFLSILIRQIHFL